MAEIKFYLEKRKNKIDGGLIVTNVPIILFYSFNGERLQYYTGIRIDASKWDEKNMKVLKGFAEASEINRELGKLKTRIEEIHEKAKVLGEDISVEYFRDRLKGSDSIVKSKKDFATCYEEYYFSSTLIKRESTLRDIKTSFSAFSKFSNATGIKLEFKNINQEFYDAFLDYCFNQKGFKNGYTGKLIKDLKAFLNWATDRNYNTNLDFRKKSFKKLTEEPEIIFLTYEELIYLLNFDLTSDERLKQVRDVFCFGCFTGMRYSDISALKPEHISDDFIRYRVVKTGQNNMIPLNQYSRKIINEYKGKLGGQCLPVASHQKINDYLKELFQKVKLNRKVQQVYFQGAKASRTTAPLHEVITFHMSKKTFMTNFLAKGGSLLTAMAITGNKDFKTAKRYFKVVDTLKADEMAKVFG